MKTELVIQNLKCGGCAHTITTKVSELDAINNVEVNVENSTVSFIHNSIDDLNFVTNKLLSLGYPVEGDKNSVVSKAKSFVSCATGKISK